MDSEIDKAVDTISDNTNLINKFKSSWSPSKTEELTNQVTEIAFNSAALKSKFNQVSQNVASEISDKLEIASAKSSSDAIDCLQKFVNKQYSQNFVNIFSQKINASVPDSQESNTSLELNTELINSHKFGFAAGTILALSFTSRRIAKTIGTRIFSQIGKRILGRIGSAVIPFVGETGSECC